jgi:hypothetical protein
MKSLFTRFGSSGPVVKSAAKEEIQDQVKKTQESLTKLRKSKTENFPLLNEVTRLGSLYSPKIYCCSSFVVCEFVLAKNGVGCVHVNVHVRFVFPLKCIFMHKIAVQKLDALVGRMVEGDLKQVWVTQLSELRRDLTAATESQIEISNRKPAAESSPSPQTSPSGDSAGLEQDTWP